MAKLTTQRGKRSANLRKGSLIAIDNDADEIVIKMRDAEPPLERSKSIQEPYYCQCGNARGVSFTECLCTACKKPVLS